MERYPESWQARLPSELQGAVFWPQRVEAFHEDSVPASKWRGYDTLGQLCYYRHVFTLWDDVYDDEDPYRRLIMSESLEAWRMLDGRWIRHLQRSEGPDQCRQGARDGGFEIVSSQDIPRL